MNTPRPAMKTHRPVTARTVFSLWWAVEVIIFGVATVVHGGNLGAGLGVALGWAVFLFPFAVAFAVVVTVRRGVARLRPPRAG